MAKNVDKNAILWGYRIFLDREPENKWVIQDKLKRLKTMADLRTEFLQSSEFKMIYPVKHIPPLSGNEKPMQIEFIQSEQDIEKLFNHIQQAWQHLGDTEPFWSVLSASMFEKANIDKNKEIFYQSGQYEVQTVFDTLTRIGIDFSNFSSCLEYGCGLGRVTKWLAERFQVVYGYDISKSHLKHADEYFKSKNIKNIKTVHLKSIQDTRSFPKVDFIYSMIVLQHNPPPIIELVIKDFLAALNPNGIAYFQVPTFRAGYSFNFQRYLEQNGQKNEIEMHVLPQSIIFNIAQQNNAIVREVIDDDLTGGRSKEVSNTFVIQKLG